MDLAWPVPCVFPARLLCWRRTVPLFLAAWLGACASVPSGTINAEPDRPAPVGDTAAPAGKLSPTPPADSATGDPLEGFNRTMYGFNEKLDDYVMKPVARFYREWFPEPLRAGISNFISNLSEPIIIVNDLFQGKFTQALSDLGRFVTNTTMGVFGIFDPATPIGLTRHNEDFGQTLGFWGVGEGPYIVWPLLGPSTLRDTGGDAVDWSAYPPNHLDDNGTRNTLYGVKVVDKRDKLLDATDIIEQAAKHDPYIFVREAYRQRRKSQIYDGNPPREVPEGLFDDDGPAPPAPGRP